jgi:hypothetical protein
MTGGSLALLRLGTPELVTLHEGRPVAVEDDLINLAAPRQLRTMSTGKWGVLRGEWGVLRAGGMGKTSFVPLIPGKAASKLIVDSSNSLSSSCLAGIPEDESEGNGQQ